MPSDPQLGYSRSGVNGGYIAPETLVYNITNQYTQNNQTTTSNSLEEPEIATGEQDWLFYYVTATNNQGTSERAMSTTLVAGQPYAAPFYEGFPSGVRSNFWGTTQGSADYEISYWNAEGSAEDADGNGGTVYYHHGVPGNHNYFFSGKIDISKTTDPVLEYYYVYRAQKMDVPFNTYIIRNGNDTVLIDSRNPASYSNPEPFKRVRVPLSDFKDTKYIQLLFDGHSGDNFTLIQLDGIAVRNYYAKDLKVPLSSDKQAAADGDTVNFTAKVENCGSETSGVYEARLYDGERLLLIQKGNSLEPDATREHIFPVSVNTLDSKRNLHAEIAYTDDQDLSNNISETLDINISLPVYPAPRALHSITNSSRVQLSWDVPEYESFTLPCDEGAESLTDTSDELGDWTTIDNDGGATIAKMEIGWDNHNVPNGGQPMGFIALNPETHNIPGISILGDVTGWGAHGGNRYFTSFVNADTANDDWLISPELNGEEQTVTMWISGSCRIRQHVPKQYYDIGQ